MFSTYAYAQQAAGQTPGVLESIIIPMLFVFFMFYFLIVRPNQKRQGKHTDFLQSLKKGDSVLTSSGIFGTIEGINENFVTLQVAEDVNIRVLKSQIASNVKKDEMK